MHQKISFGNYDCALPMKQATVPIIFRCLWTSYDYLSHEKIHDDIVVGGIVNFQMFAYPELCKTSNSKYSVKFIIYVRVGHEKRTANRG